MGQFGEKLRREREMRAIGLEEIATATKIGARSLRALEEEKFELLPGGIFNKGFVRAYAKYVGLDEEEAVADYLAAVQSAAKSSELDISLLSEQVKAARRAPGQGRGGRVLAFLWVVLVVAGVVAAGFSGWHHVKKWRARQAEERQQLKQQNIAPAAEAMPQAPVSAAPQEPAANGPAAVNASSASVGPSTGPVQQATPQQGDASPITILVRAKDRAWIQVESDGKTVAEETLDPDSPQSGERAFRAKDRLVLVVGNPKGIEVTFNGQPVGQLGPPGVRRTITFTPAGIQQ